MNLKCIFCDVVFNRENLGENQELLQTCNRKTLNRVALKYFGLDIVANWDLTLVCVDSNCENEEIKVPLPLCLPCSEMMINIIELDTQLEYVQSEISQLVAKASLLIIDRFSTTPETSSTISTQDSISITVQRLENDEIEVLEEEKNVTFQEEEQLNEFNFVEGGKEELKEVDEHASFEISIDNNNDNNQAENNNDVQVHVIDVVNSQIKDALVVDDFVSEKVHSLRKIIFDHYKPQVVLNTCDSQDDSPAISTKKSKSIKKIPKKRKRGRPKKESVDPYAEFSKTDTSEKSDACKNDEGSKGEGEKEIEEDEEIDFKEDDDDPNYSDDDDEITSQRPRKKRKVVKKNTKSNNANDKSAKKQFRSTKEIENGIHLYRKWTFKEVETGFICLTCPLEKQKVRKNRTDCIKHINKRHNMDRARCDKCRRSYRNEKLLESHECRPKVITRVYRVKNIGDGKFLYDNTFPFEQIGNTVEYKCMTCSIIKRGHGYITAHIKETHSNPTKYVCQDCGKTFEKLKLFKNHQSTHSDICIYTCESCGKQCKTQSLLKAHQMMHASLAFKCDGCDRSFKYKKSLNRHRKDAGHPELSSTIDTRPLHALSCKSCHKTYLTQKSMDQHALSCTGVQKFACYFPKCSKFFVKRSYITKHIKLVHTKDKQQVGNIVNDQNLRSTQVIEAKDKDDKVHDVQETLLESTNTS